MPSPSGTSMQKSGLKLKRSTDWVSVISFNRNTCGLGCFLVSLVGGNTFSHGDTNVKERKHTNQSQPMGTM